MICDFYCLFSAFFLANALSNFSSEESLERLLKSRFIVSSKLGFVFILLLLCKPWTKALSLLILLFISSYDIVNVKLNNEPFNIESGLRERVFCKNYNLSIAYLAIVFDFCVCWYCEMRVWSKDSSSLLTVWSFFFIIFDDICRLSQL